MKAPKKAKKAKAAKKVPAAKKTPAPAKKALAKKAAPTPVAKKAPVPKKAAPVPKKAAPVPKKRAAKSKSKSTDSQPAIRIGSKPKGPVVSDVVGKRHRQLISVKTKVPLTTAAQLFARHHMALVVVVDDDGKFHGVLSERDVVKSLGAFAARAAQMTVGEVNTRKVKACALETPLDLVLQTMRDGGFHHMPVVTQGRIEAIVSVVDVLAHLAGKTDAIIGLHDGPPPIPGAPAPVKP